MLYVFIRCFVQPPSAVVLMSCAWIDLKSKNQRISNESLINNLSVQGNNFKIKLKLKVVYIVRDNRLVFSWNNWYCRKFLSNFTKGIFRTKSNIRHGTFSENTLNTEIVARRKYRRSPLFEPSHGGYIMCWILIVRNVTCCWNEVDWCQQKQINPFEAFGNGSDLLRKAE